ncbi:MAG: SET domain-containing protein-lysine N-methyltransferase [Ferruginibacter sp.]|nr:SET domain-containing protein-lysine N-methyltransferase [Ferruginibacter sp.]
MLTNNTTQNKAIVSNHVFAIRLQDVDNGQNSLHSAKSFKKGEVISNFSAGITQHFATYLTIQVNTNTHITLVPQFLQYINHSCNPSVFFDTTTMQLIALQDLNEGDEFTFFYPSTEWDMAQPFVCNCGSANCLQLINGASHLSSHTLQKYKLTNFIQQQLQSQKQAR